MARKKIIGITLDSESLNSLDEIAKRFEGNRSMAIRFCIKQTIEAARDFTPQETLSWLGTPRSNIMPPE